MKDLLDMATLTIWETNSGKFKLNITWVGVEFENLNLTRIELNDYFEVVLGSKRIFEQGISDLSETHIGIFYHLHFDGDRSMVITWTNDNDVPFIANVPYVVHN